MSATTAPRLTDTEVRELASAFQTGADGVFSGDWHRALHDTAEQYAGEQVPAATGGAA